MMNFSVSVSAGSMNWTNEEPDLYLGVWLFHNIMYYKQFQD